MTKIKNKLKNRSDYFKKVVSKSTRTHEAVKKLANKYYISERTVYRDLAK